MEEALYNVDAVNKKFERKVLVLTCLFFLLHLILAAIMELGNDEAYYWFYTQHLQWNYFDHPPLVAFWARIFTADLAWQDYELFVRLGSVVGAALSTWFLFKAVSLLETPKAGWYVAILYNTSFYASIVAGLFIMPDAPQMIFWTFCMWMFARMLRNERSWLNWMLFAIGAGLCIMSKVHGVFLWFGLGAWCIFHKKEWLRLPQLYTAALITAVVASPILVWNAQNDFVTYNFHSKRVNIIGWSINFKNFLTELLGQLLFNNPVNVILILLALRIRPRQHYYFFLWMGLPLAILLLFVSLFRPIFPHWSGPAYVSLLPVAAGYLAGRSANNLLPRALKYSIAAFAVFALAWPAITNGFPGTWGSKSTQNYGRGDVTLDRYGWRRAGRVFTDYYQSELQKGRFSANTPVVCNTWWGAHVEYYFCRPAKLKMIGLGPLHETHHYLWTNELRKNFVDFEIAICIVPSDEDYDAAQHYANYYQQVQLVRTIEITRSGKKARSFNIYRLSGWKANLPVIETK